MKLSGDSICHSYSTINRFFLNNHSKQRLWWFYFKNRYNLGMNEQIKLKEESEHFTKIEKNIYFKICRFAKKREFLSFLFHIKI